MKKVNVFDKFKLFHDYWSPKIIGEVNNQEVKIAKVKGEFVWHNHENEDELFFVLKGQLTIEFRNTSVALGPGDMVVVPKGVDHKPVAVSEVWLMLFEPMGTKHTGNTKYPMTVDHYDRLL